MAKYKKDRKKYKKVRKNLQRKRYKGSKEGRRLYGNASALAPQLSHDKLQTVGALYVAGALADAGMDVNLKDVQGCLPGRCSMPAIIADTAVDCFLTVAARIEENPYVFITCDKANSEKAGAKSATFPKMLSFVERSTGEVYEFLLDCDACGSASENAAAAIEHSLKKLGLEDIFVLQGQAMDSGGGGTLHSLQRSLEARGLTAPLYRVCSCSLHNVQTCLRQCIQQVFGEGGTVDMVDPATKKVRKDYKKNAMQLLNGLYNLFTYLDVDEMRAIWEIACNDLGITDAKFVKLTNPVVTRWWLIGVTASEVNKYWRVWEKIMEGLVRMKKPRTANGATASAIQDIAAANKNLMSMPEIEADIQLITHLHEYWVFPHFQHLQKGDPLTGDVSGYQGRSLTLRYFFMLEDLERCKDGKWRENDTFNNFQGMCELLDNEETKERCERKADHSFRVMAEFLIKHFDPWVNEHLPYALFSPEFEVAKTVANFITGGQLLWEQDPNPPTCHSKFHERDVNLREFERFLRQHCTTLDAIKATDDIAKYLPAIEQLKTCSLWEEQVSHPLTELRDHYILHMAALPTVTHMIERAVKRANNTNLQGRSEKTRSITATTNTELVKNGSLKRKNDKNETVFVRSKKKGEHMINYVISEHKRIEVNNYSQQKRKQIKERLTSNEHTYKKVRTEETVANFQENRNRDIAPHRYEQRTGVDQTALLSKRIPYSEMRKNKGWEPLMLEEVAARGIVLNATDNYTTMMKKLKEHEGNTKDFAPVLDYKRFQYW